MRLRAGVAAWATLSLATVACAGGLPQWPIWPIPSSGAPNGPFDAFVVLAHNFTFVPAGPAPSARLGRAAARYEGIIHNMYAAAAAEQQESARAAARAGIPVVSQLTLAVASADETLSLATDYSYTLSVAPNGTAWATATSIYGAMYAMETFVQLINGTVLVSDSIQIQDAPMVRHRGLMLDSGRRFFPVATVLEVLDALSYLKMNVLHLHASDVCRFSVESKQYGNLTDQLVGAMGGHYLQSDIAQIVAYAADRGIRVVAEFDIPGHSRGFRNLTFDGLAFCDSVYQRELYDDPAGQTRAILGNVFTEMAGLFPDLNLHVGSDETESMGPCTNATIFSLEHAVLTTLEALGKQPVGWEEILFTTGSATPNTVINTWSRHMAPEAIGLGYDAIESHSPWFYLNDLSVSFADLWHDIRQNMTGAQLAKLHGGEVSLWTDEFTNPPQCGAFGPMSPYPGFQLFPPTRDAQFSEAVLALIFPRAIVAAGAFWNFDASLDPTSAEFAEYIDFINGFVLQMRNITSCPSGCACDYQSQCNQPYIPCGPLVSGAQATLQSCASASAGALPLALNANGTLSVVSDLTLCLTVHGTDPSSGYPSAQFLACEAGPPTSQVFAFKGTTDAIVHPASGYCLDVTGGSTTPGSAVEFYSCTGNSNQQWSLQKSTQTWVNAKSGLCLGACVSSSSATQ